MEEKKNPSVRERLSTIETAIVFIKEEIRDIKGNHLKSLSDRQWWLLGTVLISILLGIAGLILRLILR